MFHTPKSTRNIPWTRFITYGIVIIGTILNLLFIVPNGDYSCQGGVCGIRIGEWHYHDALWHIAVARNSFVSLPFVFPSAAGFALTSYNYLLGGTLFLFEKIWIHPLITYFKILPILGNVGLIYTLFRYFRLTRKTEVEKLWISFFVYFGSSFSYLLVLYRNNFAEFSILKGFPVVATLQPAFVTSNIQFFLTLPVLIYFLTNLISDNKTRFSAITDCVLLTLTTGLKIYSGLIALVILILGSCQQFLKTRGYRVAIVQTAIYLMIFFLAIVVLFLPFNRQGTGFPFVWSPLAIPHVITESPGLLYHKDFTLGRYFMYGLQKFSPRLILYESISAFLFIVWNLGSRALVLIVGVYLIAKRSTSREMVLLATLGLSCLVIPIFFIQKGGGWYNTIQFAYIGVYLIGILAGLLISRLWRHSNTLALFVSLCIVLLTIPNNIFMFNLIAKDKELIPLAEMRALSFLSTQPPGVVLSFPDNKNSSYVPALSRKVGYMIDYEQSALLDLPTKQMIQDVENRECAVLEKVDYLYLNSSKGIEYTSCPLFKSKFKQIYTNASIEIFLKK